MVDRPVDRCAQRAQEMSADRPVDRLKAGCSLFEPSRPAVDGGHESVDRPVDRQTRFDFPFRIQILFLLGIESNRGFLKPRDSVAINKG